MNEKARSSSASLGIFGSLADGSGTLAGGTGGATGASATMPLGSSRPRDSSDFFSSALSRCSRPISLSSAARSSGTILQDQPVAAQPHCATCPVRESSRTKPSPMRWKRVAAVIRRGRRGSLALASPESWATARTRSGEPGHQNQQGGADWGKTSHFGLPGEPRDAARDRHSAAASAKLKPSIAAGRNEARAALVPTASMTQRKRLKTLSLSIAFRNAAVS